MTLDDILLKVLEDGPATVNEIVERLEGRVRSRLNMLRARGVVIPPARAEAALIASSLTNCYGPALPRRRSARRVSRALRQNHGSEASSRRNRTLC
jgi:hypothetical protein